MLSRTHVLRALETQRAAFAFYEQTTGTGLQAYGEALRWFEQQTPQRLLNMLPVAGRPGALPTAERQPGQSIIHHGPGPWHDHTQARAWAKEILAGVTTVAVDGSQIAPDPRYSIPVGAVQVGWFVNPHDAEQRYTKDIRFQVLPPEDLSSVGDDVAGYNDLMVNVRRFELECQVLVEQIRRLAGEPRRALCLLDGSLTMSFAAHMRPSLRARYLRAMERLLWASRESRVPLIGYVDTSRASDMISMLRLLQPELPDAGLHDGQILRQSMRWGDRSELLTCARDDGLFDEGDPAADYYREIVFTYLKTTASNAPARVDLPHWLLEEGLVDHTLDILRAECIVGTGYPYAIETADAVAVITTQDRTMFYRAFEQFLAEQGISLRFSLKATSKQGRR